MRGKVNPSCRKWSTKSLRVVGNDVINPSGRTRRQPLAEPGLRPRREHRELAGTARTGAFVSGVATLEGISLSTRWPQRLPSSRFGQLPGDLLDYTPTEPLLVVEVNADVCLEPSGGGVRRHSDGCAATYIPPTSDDLTDVGELRREGTTEFPPGFADPQRAVSASHRVRRVRTWTSRPTRRMLAVVSEPAREWRPGEQILLTLPDG